MPKFKIRTSRFVNGRYVHATPDSPAEIELSDEQAAQAKGDSALYPLESGAVKLKPHFADKLHGGVPTSADLQSKPVAKDEDDGGKGKGGKGKRPSDAEPI